MLRTKKKSIDKLTDKNTPGPSFCFNFPYSCYQHQTNKIYIYLIVDRILIYRVCKQNIRINKDLE